MNLTRPREESCAGASSRLFCGPIMRVYRPVWGRCCGAWAHLLVVLAVLGFVLSTVGLPHSHNPASPGIYNEEHDLTLYTTVASIGLASTVPVATPILLVLLISGLSWRRRAAGAQYREAGPRAPPLR